MRDVDLHVGQDMPELKPVETGPLPPQPTEAPARSRKRELYAMKQGLEAHDLQSWEDVTL